LLVGHLNRLEGFQAVDEPAFAAVRLRALECGCDLIGVLQTLTNKLV
jgi:hypothetical protein